MTSETLSQLQGNMTVTTTINDYTTGGDALGAVKVTSVASARVKNGRTTSTSTRTTDGYGWYGGAVLTSSATTTGTSSTVTTSMSLAYSVQGALPG